MAFPRNRSLFRTAAKSGVSRAVPLSLTTSSQTNATVGPIMRLRGRISVAMRPWFKPTRSLFVPSFWTYLLLRPLWFELWFRSRAGWFLLRRRWHVAGKQVEGWDCAHHQRVIDHNFGQRWLFNRYRTEKVMNVLRSVGGVSRQSRVLVIGPRNEAEILLLSLYGFALKNIVGVDLLTYSPKILQQDMHNLQFPDESFDVVYVLYTLPYAYDLRKACSEIVRVLKNDGVVAAGFHHTQSSPKALRAAGSELRGGLDELLANFAPHVDHVFWHEIDPMNELNEYRASTIFRIRKDESREMHRAGVSV